MTAFVSNACQLAGIFQLAIKPVGGNRFIPAGLKDIFLIAIKLAKILQDSGRVFGNHEPAFAKAAAPFHMLLLRRDTVPAIRGLICDLTVNEDLPGLRIIILPVKGSQFTDPGPQTETQLDRMGIYGRIFDTFKSRQDLSTFLGRVNLVFIVRLRPASFCDIPGVDPGWIDTIMIQRKRMPENPIDQRFGIVERFLVMFSSPTR